MKRKTLFLKIAVVLILVKVKNKTKVHNLEEICHTKILFNQKRYFK